jgi:glycosyltransferase involved in cell wall biosynthesis
MDFPLGTGIVTDSRREVLSGTIDHVQEFARQPDAAMVVADDGSSDGTLAMLHDKQVPVITRVNMGIARNTARLARVGYGGAEEHIDGEGRVRLFPIKGGVIVASSRNYHNTDEIEHNFQVARMVMCQQGYRAHGARTTNCTSSDWRSNAR